MGCFQANDVYDTVKPLFHHLKLFGLCADIPRSGITPKKVPPSNIIYLLFFIGLYSYITFVTLFRHEYPLIYSSLILSFVYETSHAICLLNAINTMVWFYKTRAKIFEIVRELHLFDVALGRMHLSLDNSKWHFRFTTALLVIDGTTLAICAVYLWSFSEIHQMGEAWSSCMWPILYLAYAFNFVLVMMYGTVIVILVSVRYSALNRIFR